MKRFIMSLSQKLDDELAYMAVRLEVSRAEVVRRAITLMRHAADADKVVLVNSKGEQQLVIVR